MKETVNFQSKPDAPDRTLGRARTHVRRIIRKAVAPVLSEGGGITVEFAILAPLLVIGFVFLVFQSMLVFDRINLRQIVDAGAEAAMRDPGYPAVKARMDEIALAKGYSLYEGVPPLPKEKVFNYVARNCACPGTMNLVQEACDVPCPDGRPIVVRYALRLSYIRNDDALASAFQGLTGVQVMHPMIVIYRNLVIR